MTTVGADEIQICILKVQTIWYYFVACHFRQKEVVFIDIHFPEIPAKTNRYIISIWKKYNSAFHLSVLMVNKKTCIWLLWIPHQNFSKMFKELLNSTKWRHKNGYRKTIHSDSYQNVNITYLNQPEFPSPSLSSATLVAIAFKDMFCRW